MQIALRARFRARPADSIEVWLVRKERDAERLSSVSGDHSAEETAAGEGFKECGWRYEKGTY